MPNTSGLVNRRNVIATSDATVVSRLKQAGAIPLGVTNCSELCMWFESSNRVYGRTNNPYDLQRIVGGSSGEPRHRGAVPHQQRVQMQQGKSSPSPLRTALTCRWAAAELTGLSPGQGGRPVGGPSALDQLDVPPASLWFVCLPLRANSSAGVGLGQGSPTSPSCAPDIARAGAICVRGEAAAVRCSCLGGCFAL